MAERLGLKTQERELKIGQSFTNPRSKGFHTVRYDFKPASVDTNKKATLDVGDNHQVSVTVPHLDGAGTTQTVFKGSNRPYTKECVLIIDRVTGEITLEKLSCNIQVKKTRSEYNKAALPHDRLSASQPERSSNNANAGASGSSLSQRSATPPMPSNLGHRISSKTRVAPGSRRPDRPITQLMPKHSPLRASPGHPSPSGGIGNQRSPGRSRDMYYTSNESHNPSTLASLPMIGMEEFADPIPPSSQPSSHHRLSAPPSQPTSLNNGKSISPLSAHSDNENGVGTISDSSSSSSDSDSDSDSPDNVKINKNGYGNAAPTKVNGPDLATLDEDLCLSESGSDSD